MSCADEAIDKVLLHESGKLIENDNGRGFSRWGWTQQTLQGLDPSTTGTTILLLNRPKAADLYKKYYWSDHSLDRITSCQISTKLLDLMVNTGTGTAIKLLQRCLNSFFQADLEVDGILGDKSFAAINAADPDMLLSDYREMAKHHYVSLADSNENLAKFLPGWLSRLDA